MTAAENQELPIASAVNNYWQPIQTWAAAALVISQNGLALSTAATAIFLLLILYALFVNRQENHMLLSLYKKLSAQEQLLIKVISNAKNPKNLSTEAVNIEFQKLSSAPVPEGYVEQKLNEAENAGLIKKTLTNRDDAPVLVWSSHIPKQNKPSFFSRPSM